MFYVPDNIHDWSFFRLPISSKLALTIQALGIHSLGELKGMRQHDFDRAIQSATGCYFSDLSLWEELGAVLEKVLSGNRGLGPQRAPGTMEYPHEWTRDRLGDS